MSELEKTKIQAIDSLKSLCARCGQKEEHVCPVAEVIARIEGINGIPVIVNDKLKHVVFSN